MPTPVKILPFALAFCLLAGPAFGQEDAKVSLSINPEKTVLEVDQNVYGHFLEHICNSIHGGLWGDLFLNGSFEIDRRSYWAIEDDVVGVTRRVTSRPLIFGDPNWTDYELTCEAQKLEGSEGFMIVFRAEAPGRHYWINFGGWGNKEHGIEKRGAGWNLPRVAGSVEQDKWHQVRIRCEGPRFQIWLDGEKVFDATDPRAFLSGSVGLSVYDTRSRFRNIKVTDLDGNVLHEGLPPRQATIVTPTYWEIYGSADVTSDAQSPVNSHVAQKIVSSDATGESGLRQHPFYLVEGETYKGSIWLRGDAPQGAVIRFLAEDGQPIVEKSFDQVGSEWRQFPFEFVAPATHENAVCQIALRGQGTLYLDDVEMFSAASLATGGFRPDLLQAIAELRPPVIRWPGGCFASAYRWKDGVGPRHQRVCFPREIWEDRDMNKYGTDEFIKMCRLLGAEPVIVVNLAAGVQEALDWMEYCNGPVTSKYGRLRAENGHPEPYNVKYWEVDNEMWGMGEDRYNKAIAEFAPAMRAAWPDTVIIVCGSYGYDDGVGCTDGWDQRIIDANAQNFDYISIHYYNGLRHRADYVDDPRRYEAFIRDLGRRLRESENPNALIYCSEYGMTTDFGGTGPDWRSGLYTAALLNGFERTGDVLRIAGPALFLRRTWAKMWDNALINFDHRTWFGGGNYVATKLWRDHYAPDLLELEGPDRPLNATAVRTEDGRAIYFKVVNPKQHAVELELTVQPGFTVGDASMRIINPGNDRVKNSLAEPDALRIESHPVEHEGQTVRVHLPAISAGAVTLDSAN